MLQDRPIVIKRVKKNAEHPYHGGAWKVAYADFVTAMMAFFLLLWLLNVTTDVQKKGIADYFAPASLSQSESGAGGMLGGRTLISKGSRLSDSGVPSAVVAQTPPEPPVMTEKRDDSDQATDVESEAAAANGSVGHKMTEHKPLDQPETGAKSPGSENLNQQLAAKEQKAFEQAKTELRQAIDQSPELNILKNSLLVDMTPDGLRIQIVDQQNATMFPNGSAQMTERTGLLLQKIAQVIKKLPNKISISGHTDATPYRRDAAYDNWELSSDRANASRRALIDAGLATDRVAQVVGMANEDPLLKNDPTDPRNRRISIVLLRARTQTAAAAAPAASVVAANGAPSPAVAPAAVPSAETMPTPAAVPLSTAPVLPPSQR